MWVAKTSSSLSTFSARASGKTGSLEVDEPEAGDEAQIRASVAFVCDADMVGGSSVSDRFDRNSELASRQQRRTTIKFHGREDNLTNRAGLLQRRA
jgi:hypothetical protein